MNRRSHAVSCRARTRQLTTCSGKVRFGTKAVCQGLTVFGQRIHFSYKNFLALVANMSKLAHVGAATEILGKLPHNRWLAMPLLLSALTAGAIPPPPPAPPQLRKAGMTVTIQLVEASNGRVTKITKLCKVSGTIPVYADDGRAYGANVREISGCTMLWKGQSLNVSVRGAMAIAHGRVTFATAIVRVVPPDAIPLCAELCAPQPLADSSGEIRISGTPKSLKFSLSPNPVSILNAKPTVWLEADVAVGSRVGTL